MAGLAGASALGAAGLPLIKPFALREGDTVGLITPSTGVFDPGDIALADRTLKYFNLKGKYARNVKKKAGYVGGTVQERVDDLNAMFRDPEVKAVMPLRGGYGSAQLLDRLDYNAIRANPKIFVGYSDITALHLAIHQRTGLVTFHGPVFLSRFGDYTEKAYRKAIFKTEPIGVLTNPADSNALRPEHTVRTIRGGMARGPLIGGNLTLISTTMGTPYEIDTRGKILFIEDVGEEPYRIDRMLTQLRLSRKLDSAAGLIFGECAGCSPNDYKASFPTSGYTLGEVVDNLLGDLRIPVVAGLTIGHTTDQLTLPLGVEATLDADKGQLMIDESGVR